MFLAVLSREFVLHEGQMQRTKFIPNMIDGTQEKHGDHGLRIHDSTATWQSNNKVLTAENH